MGLTAVLAAALLALRWWTNWPIVLALIAVAGLPVAALLARDRYRNLGHAVIGRRC